MPAKIDQSLIPPVIKESVDPDILDRAQSIEWSITNDAGQDERGFVDGSHEDFLSSQNLMFKSHHGRLVPPGTELHRKVGKNVEWLDQHGGRDSGFERTPISPSLGLEYADQRVDLSPLDDFTVGEASFNGSAKRHPQGVSPYPIYQVNQSQLQGDVFFEAAPKAAPGERTVHYEKATRVLNEQDLNLMGLDPHHLRPNSRARVDEREEETIESSVLKEGSRELEDLYNSMRNNTSDYFDRQRARSVSPDRLGGPVEECQKKTIIFSSVEEINNQEQEFYPYRDAHQGKPLPGDNEYGTWGSRRDEQKQWKLCNGQWVRVAEPKPKPPPKYEKYLAEKVKCKPPKKIRVARAEPVEKIAPQSGSNHDNSDSEPDLDELAFSPVELEVEADRSPSPSPSPPPVVKRSFAPKLDRSSRPRRQPLDTPDVDIDALKDKYRPKQAETPAKAAAETNASPEPNPGTILLKPPTPPVEEIKVEPIKPTYVEMRRPLKPEGEEEKMIEDPNLMWMHMGPAQYGPPFGTLKKRKGREEAWFGPPCELCHKQIEERRCMLAENMKFHCWHFACSFCLKTLKPADFLIAQADGKPYCLNCHKREFPEISLTNLSELKE